MKNSLIPYDSLASIYEKWSTGDWAYDASFNFYTEYLKLIPSPICELGIGTGRIAFALANQYGKTIYGIDESPKMLEITQEKFDTAGLSSQIHLICSDMVHFSLPQKMNAIYLPFRTIGHLLNKEDILQLFTSVYNALDDEGIFIFDHYIFSKDWAETHNQKKIQMFKSNDTLIEDYYDYDFPNKLMNCKIYVNGKVQSKFKFSYNDPPYYTDLLKECHFIIDTLYGDFDNSLYNEESFSQIYICKKMINHKITL